MIQRLAYGLLLSGGLFTIQALGATTDERPCENAPSVKVRVTNSGIYRIPGGDLREVFGCAALKLEQLRLSSGGESTPYSVVGITPSTPGDLVFYAHHLAGSNSYYNEFSPYNTYWLTQAEEPASRIIPALQGGRHQDASVLRSWTHLEKDELRVRFPGHADAPQPEVWYWARLNSIDPEPFVVPLDLQQIQTDSSPTIRIGLRGWSTPPTWILSDMSDHRVEVFLNGQLIGSGEWQGQEEFIIDIQSIPVEVLNDAGPNSLSLGVPERTPESSLNPLADAVLLNWVEVNYPHTGLLPAGQHKLHVKHQEGGWFQMSGESKTPPVLVGETGQQLKPIESYQRDNQFWHRYATLQDTSTYVAVVGDVFHQPVAMVADNPSNLRNTNQQADYLMLTHRRLREAVEPLADFHRQQGLTVQVIDIEDVYDEFNEGVLAPTAIREFISHAYHNWQQPKPRFVLLVGDASWEVHNAVGNDRNYADWTFRQHEKSQFAKNGSDAYADSLIAADRNLMPTWQVDTYEGYAASDNVFVTVDGDDYLPDLAIGRFPVSDPLDVSAIVNKTINYHQQSEVGPWRRKVLWITNEQTGFQWTSNQLDQTLGENGFSGTKIYPSAQEKDNVRHQEELQDAFNDGQLIVHFLGHGGRYIWRTGPPDFRKNHDLFTLDHLDQLTPTTRLPFVLSMTCYSAPFDHPTADSIGEKFLRMPDRGAIGILAASWRNSPTQNFSQVMLNELTRPGTMGEAVMRAKQKSQSSRMMIETYNLLGDPAARLALPGHHINLTIKQRNDYIEIKGKVVDAAFSGQVVIDLQDTLGNLIQSRQAKLRRGKFKLRVPNDPVEPVGEIRAYAWNPKRHIDAMGSIEVSPAMASSKSVGAPRQVSRAGTSKPLVGD